MIGKECSPTDPNKCLKCYSNKIEKFLKDDSGECTECNLNGHYQIEKSGPEHFKCKQCPPSSNCKINQNSSD